jgi:hypothetical protein
MARPFRLSSALFGRQTLLLFLPSLRFLFLLQYRASVTVNNAKIKKKKAMHLSFPLLRRRFVCVDGRPAKSR